MKATYGHHTSHATESQRSMSMPVPQHASMPVPVPNTAPVFTQSVRRLSFGIRLGDGPQSWLVGCPSEVPQSSSDPNSS